MDHRITAAEGDSTQSLTAKDARSTVILDLENPVIHLWGLTTADSENTLGAAWLCLSI